MNKRTELITTKALVKKILEQDKRTRNSDSFLYFKVLTILADDKRMDMNRVPVTVFLLRMNSWGFPPFESVRRARQQLQHDFPELSADEAVQVVRNKYEDDYREFARG